MSVGIYTLFFKERWSEHIHYGSPIAISHKEHKNYQRVLG